MMSSKFNRRKFLKRSATVSASVIGLGLSGMSSGHTSLEAENIQGRLHEQKGTQRLSIDRLKKWESLKYGMFIHYGMSTFTGKELHSGENPSTGLVDLIRAKQSASGNARRSLRKNKGRDR